jgi:HSP20 family molecular chaperone IbpA
MNKRNERNERNYRNQMDQLDEKLTNLQMDVPQTSVPYDWYDRDEGIWEIMK